MKKYKNLSGNSGIDEYEIWGDHMHIRFSHGKTYEYDYERPGKEHVENMKEYAEKGQRLATYINKHVRDNYKRIVS